MPWPANAASPCRRMDMTYRQAKENPDLTRSWPPCPQGTRESVSWPTFQSKVNIFEGKIYVRKGLKRRCQSEFSKTIQRWIYSTSPVQCVHLWSLEVSAVRFTLNSLMTAHERLTLDSVELTGHHQGAFSTILYLEIYKRAFRHGLIKAWSLAPKTKWMVEADRCSPAQGRSFTASLKDLFQVIHAE